MFFYNLCSSSGGNSSYLGDLTSGILFDAGIGIRNFAKALELAGLTPDCVRAIFVTHEHSDHVHGLDAISSRFDIPVYASAGTVNALLEKKALSGRQKIHILDQPEEVNGFFVTPFSTPHDSAESVGFHVDCSDGRSVGVCTDLGYPSETVMEGILGCDFVMLESNYDSHMLLNGSYPYFLKQRIKSRRGHLSNDQCAHVLEQLVYYGTRQVVLAHLSEENNRPELALSHSVNYLKSRSMLEDADYCLDVLPRFTQGKVFELL